MTPTRLSATRDQYYATANIYDASGNRAWKLGGEINWMWNNGQGWQAYGDLNLRTWYQSDLVTITDQAMTKHYFIAGQRIASKLAESLSPEVAQNLKAKPVTPLSGDVNELGTNMTERLRRDFECVGLDYNAFYPGEVRLEAIENLLNAPEQPNEYQLFFYHSDHLGSSSFITDINGDATQHLQYLPFGEDFVHQQNTAAYYTPYTFSGKERDMETNLSYFGARYYESSLSIWLSVDPLSDKYPSLSAYNYCALNPVMLVDPDGREPGDFVDEKGKKIGTDGKLDGKMYIINTSQATFDENGISVKGAGISKEQTKAAKSFVESNSGNPSAFDANPSIYDSFTEIEGSSVARQAMVDIVNADNGRGGTSDANNREHGGGIMPDGQVVAGSPGDVSTPQNGAKSGTYPQGAKTTFHSHPSGTVTTGGSDSDPFSTGATIGGTTSTTGYRQAPTPRDILNAGSGVRYVFGRASGGTVYIYNNQGVRATIPQRHFVTPQN